MVRYLESSITLPQLQQGSTPAAGLRTDAGAHHTERDQVLPAREIERADPTLSLKHASGPGGPSIQCRNYQDRAEGGWSKTLAMQVMRQVMRQRGGEGASWAEVGCCAPGQKQPGDVLHVRPGEHTRRMQESHGTEDTTKPVEPGSCGLGITQGERIHVRESRPY